MDGPVKCEGRGVVVAEEEEHQRHEHHDALLHFISGLGHHRHLNDAGRGHDDGEKVDRDSQNGRVKVWLGKVIDPQEIKNESIDMPRDDSF